MLKEKGLSTSVGDEGGFAPNVPGEDEALSLIMQAFDRAGFVPGQDFVLGLDAASSEWVVPPEEGGEPRYTLPKAQLSYTTGELISHWEGLCAKYPIRSIEDPLGENDWQGFVQITHRLGSRVQIVGDDLFVTNPKRIAEGVAMKAANAVLIKPNQIGTLTQTLEAVRLAQQAGYRTILSHRSGETEDSTIAEIAVACGAGQIKTGAPCRGERTAKYNQLLRIEEGLGTARRSPTGAKGFLGPLWAPRLMRGGRCPPLHSSHGWALRPAPRRILRDCQPLRPTNAGAPPCTRVTFPSRGKSPKARQGLRPLESPEGDASLPCGGAATPSIGLVPQK